MTALRRSDLAPAGRASVAMPAPRPITPEQMSPAIEQTFIFPLQSYLDDAGATALMRQQLNKGIVGASAALQKTPGYALGLHPSSETPVAVSFDAGGQRDDSSVYILKPGEVIRPHGAPKGEFGGFSGYAVGLPFGWLGGGLARLVVFKTPDANVVWRDDTEVLFHRVRLPITDFATLATEPNWPVRFPWSNAASGANPQGSNPSISIAKQTRIELCLRVSGLAAAATMFLGFRGTDAFDTGADGVTVSTTQQRGQVLVTWPVPEVGDTSFPIVELTGGPANRLGGAECLVDLASADVALIGEYVDILRYGTL